MVTYPDPAFSMTFAEAICSLIFVECGGVQRRLAAPKRSGGMMSSVGTCFHYGPKALIVKQSSRSKHRLCSETDNIDIYVPSYYKKVGFDIYLFYDIVISYIFPFKTY